MDGWLIAGRDRHVVVTSTGTACIQSMALEPDSGRQEKETWKPAGKPNTVDVTLDVPAHDVGAFHLAIRQFGDSKPATLSLLSYNEPAKLDALHFHAGDDSATLTGTGLDQVRQVELGGLTFKPAAGTSIDAPQPNGKPTLRVTITSDAKASTLPAGDSLIAHVALQDGRTLRLPVTVEPARPSVALISHADVPPDTLPKTQFHIRLTSENDLPVSDALVFSLKSAQPFPRAGSIEIASLDSSLRSKLSLSDSDSRASLILEDPQTLLATLQPLKTFGPSAFGPIRLRAVAPDGTAGDWLPLVTLVRLPTLSGLSCPIAAPAVQSTKPSVEAAVPPAADFADKPAAPTCTLTGSGLYFIDAIATDASFTDSIRVPEGFVGSSLAVPAPTGAVYYLRLRDDPTAVDTVSLPAGPL